MSNVNQPWKTRAINEVPGTSRTTQAARTTDHLPTLAQNNGNGDGGGGGSGNLTYDDLKFLEDILGKQGVEDILRQTEERLQQNQNERNQD
jgi:hypothetical protein